MNAANGKIASNFRVLNEQYNGKDSVTILSYLTSSIIVKILSNFRLHNELCNGKDIV